jgi:hypothetical protein
MLFYITEEIAAEAEKNNLRVVEALDFVAQSHYYGRHIVFASRDILERLSKLSFFNFKRTADVFKSILNRYSTFGGIKRIISLHVELTLKLQFHVLTSDDRKYSVILCPIASKSLENLMNGVELLGENVEELSMYEFMGKYYLQKSALKINTYSKKLHGGGDTLRLVWNTEAMQESFCLAFLDSDKKWSGGGYGDTLKKVISIWKKEKYCTVSFIFSDFYREIENMIPLDVLKAVSKCNPNWSLGFKDIEMIVMSGKDVQYYDMKCGVTLKKYRKLLNHKEEKKYIDAHLSCVYSEHDDLDAWLSSLQENTILLHGLGEDVLKRSVDYLEQHSDDWLNRISLDQLLEQEWMKIGKELINWTCASSTMRV